MGIVNVVIGVGYTSLHSPYAFISTAMEYNITPWFQSCAGLRSETFITSYQASKHKAGSLSQLDGSIKKPLNKRSRICFYLTLFSFNTRNHQLCRESGLWCRIMITEAQMHSEKPNEIQGKAYGTTKPSAVMGSPWCHAMETHVTEMCTK